MAENIRLMASLVGRVVEVENPEEERFLSRNFGRARVEVDAEKPLIPGFLAPRPENLEDVWIQVKYEKLVRYCFNCGKLGHESKACEKETVEFLVKGVTRGYAATLCAQVYREQGNFQTGRNQWRSPEPKGTHGEKENNSTRYGETTWTREIQEKGVAAMCQLMGKETKGSTTVQTSEVDMEASREGERRGGVLFNNELFNQEAKVEYMGQGKEAQYGLCEFSESGLENMIKRMDGSMNLLRARKEKLMKTQARYWVELAEEEEEENKNSGAIVPFQTTEVKKLEEEMRDWSLKRKAEENPELPPIKRRKGYCQDSPKSSGDRGRAEMELRRIEEEEGPDLFSFRYDGNLDFDKGINNKGRRGEGKRIRKALFSEQKNRINMGPSLERITQDELMIEDEGRETVGNLEGQGGWPKTATKEP